MGVFSKRLLVGVSIAVSGPARAAQSQVNGDELHYNFAYRCNGERIIVARCRDDSDQSYCQVVYPDRPEVNGNQVAPVEMRGDIVAKLNACMRPNSTSVASDDSRQASRGSAAAQAVGAPGLAKTSWSVLDRENDTLVLFNKPRLRRAGDLASGWFTEVHARPKDFPEFNFKGVQFEQFYHEADCARGTLRMTAYALYGEDGRSMFSYKGPAKWDVMEPGSFGDRKFRILCGKPQALAVANAIVGDGSYLAMYTAAELDRKAVAPSAGPAARGGVTPPGLGHAKWSMLFMNDDFAIYFVPATIKRAGGSGSGWFTSVYLQPQNFASEGLSNVVYKQTLNQADCSKHLIKAPNVAAFDRDGKLLGTGPIPDATWDSVTAGSAGSRELNILCGRPQALQQKTATIGNHGDLMADYMKAELKVMEEATAPK